MIGRLRDRTSTGRSYVREGLLALLALGLLYVASGARPLLLAAISLFLIAVWRYYDRSAATEQQPAAGQPAAGAVGYEQTLEVLLGMVGREVTALIAQRAGAPMGVADLHGPLRSADLDNERYELLDPRYHDDEVLFLAIAESGFWLPRRDFVSAQLVEQEGQVGVELLVGDLHIGIYDDQASRLSEISMGRSA